MLFFGVFLAVGLGLSWFLGGTIIKSLQPWLWQETPCVIIESSVTEAGPEAPAGARIRYRYEPPGGPPVISDRIRLAGAFSGSGSSVSEAYRLSYKYPADLAATCYVNPSQREEAVLERESPLTGLFILFPLVFVGIGGVGVVAMFLKTKDETTARALSKKVAKDNRGCGAAFFLLFFVIGVAVMIPFFIIPIFKILRAQSWPAVPCTILSSGVHTNRDSDGNTYRVDIHYRYVVNGRPFASNNYAFTGSMTSSGYKGKREIASRYKTGMQTVCYPNPKDPSEAVLHRGWVNDLWFGLIPAVFCLVGLGGGFAVLRSRPKRDRNTGLPQAQPTTIATSEGAVTLKASSTPMGKFLGIFIFTAIWNGVVVVMLVSGAPWFFALIFGAVGLLMLWGTVHQFLALFNPRPTIVVNSSALALGSELEVDWSFQGNVRRIGRLRIFLRGHEEVTYRRGTSTSTDRHVFAELLICEEAAGGSIETGRASVIIPTDTMHSFEATNNKIIWKLHVKGEIAKWPDVDEEFPITVLPLKTPRES